MAMSGLQIYKLLPKTNCKDCGFPTCLAFAMKLAAKQVELDGCPHVSEEATEALSAASAPPVRLVKLGTGDREFQTGNETVCPTWPEAVPRSMVTAAADPPASSRGRPNNHKSRGARYRDRVERCIPSPPYFKSIILRTRFVSPARSRYR